ncbi:LytR/AlgR family response regulator transcription factor [Ferruginibacter yonginensis]|uniref:LytR/AlgR family response regulator transcription factor n=1 Tax=Ferruginibacter yonginensis TaxID=1310416 RepID=A0ABV8QNI8_9BACT
MIRAIHIEDEPGIVELLSNMLNLYYPNKIEILGNASTLDEATNLIDDLKPDLIFCDIQLEDGNAFQIFEKIKYLSFEIIFLTAFDEFAFKAIKYGACDYILKPINPDDLVTALNKVSNRIKTKQNSEATNQILKYLKANKELKRISLPVTDGIIFEKTDDIMYLEADGNYTHLTMCDGKKIVTIKQLKDMEDAFSPVIFFRVHNSWIVNLNFIKKYFKGINSYLEMIDGKTIPISIRRKSKFLEIWNE